MSTPFVIIAFLSAVFFFILLSIALNALKRKNLEIINFQSQIKALKAERVDKFGL